MPRKTAVQYPSSDLESLQRTVVQLTEAVALLETQVETNEAKIATVESSIPAPHGGLTMVTPLDYGARGDGVADDTVAVQAALDDSPAVYIPEGYTFAVAGANALTLNAGQRLFGGGTILMGSDGNLLLADSVSDVRLEGVTLDGSGAATAGNILLLQTCTDVLIRDCTFLNAYNNALLADECERVTVTENYFDTSRVGYVVAFSGDGVDTTRECKHITVSNNRIRNPATSGINFSETELFSCVGNVVWHDGTGGVHTAGNGGVRCTNGARIGTVAGNTVRGMSRGVFLGESSQITVTGNSIYECYYQGIFVSSDVTDSDYNSVVGNQIFNVNLGGSVADTTAAGVYVKGTGNVVAGNAITDTGSRMRIGVYEAAGSVGNLLYGNRIGGETVSDYVFVSSAPAGGELPYTPAIAGTTTAGVGTYTSQDGHAVRIGDLVWFSARLVWTAHTGTGAMVLTLPANEAGDLPAVEIRHSSVTMAAGNTMQGYIESNVVVLKEVPTGGGADAFVAMDGSGTLHVTGVYRAA